MHYLYTYYIYKWKLYFILCGSYRVIFVQLENEKRKTEKKKEKKYK